MVPHPGQVPIINFFSFIMSVKRPHPVLAGAVSRFHSSHTKVSNCGCNAELEGPEDIIHAVRAETRLTCLAVVTKTTTASITGDQVGLNALWAHRELRRNVFAPRRGRWCRWAFVRTQWC